MRRSVAECRGGASALKRIFRCPPERCRTPAGGFSGCGVPVEGEFLEISPAVTVGIDGLGQVGRVEGGEVEAADPQREPVHLDRFDLQGTEGVDIGGPHVHPDGFKAILHVTPRGRKSSAATSNFLRRRHIPPENIRVKGMLWCLHGAVGDARDWQGFSMPGWGVKRVDLWRFLECGPMAMPEFGRALNAEAMAGGDGRREMADGRWQAEEADPVARHLPSAIFHPPSTRRVLVGYSMGARLGLHALLDGGPWDAAVLVSPHPGLETERERAARRAADAEWGNLAHSGDWGKFLAKWEEQPVLASSVRRSPVSDLRRREVARSYVDWSLGAQEPLWDRLGEIGCPVLWCAGERDAKFRALGERAVGLLPRGELRVAPGAGHRVPWEAPEAFHAMLGEFLERVIS